MNYMVVCRVSLEVLLQYLHSSLLSLVALLFLVPQFLSFSYILQKTVRLELRCPVINYSRDRYRVPCWSWASRFSLIQQLLYRYLPLFSGAPSTLSNLLESKHNANNMPRLIIIIDEDAICRTRCCYIVVEQTFSRVTFARSIFF